MGFYYLCTYAIAMCVITFHYFRKKKNIVFCIMWFAYSVSAIFCVLSKAFQDEIVGSSAMHDMWYDLSDTTWWSYILLIVCYAIAFRPLAALDKYYSFEGFGKGINYKRFFVLFAYGYLICAFVFIALSFNTIVSVFQVQDLGIMREQLFGNSDNESAFVMTNNIVANIAYKVCLQLKYLAAITFIAMFKERVNTVLSIALLISSFFVYYLTATANAGRGGLIIYFFCIFLLGLNFIKYMSKKRKRKLLFFGAALAAIVLSFFITVTIQRFSKDMSSTDPTIRYISFYLGHGPIEFSKITGSLDRLGMGKVIIGRLLNHYFGTYYSWTEVQTAIGYPPIGPVFTTFLGFIYTDFGIIGSLLFVTLWSSFMLHIIKTKQNSISTMFMLGYYLYYFVTGIFGIGRLEYAALITTFLLYCALVIVEKTLHLSENNIVSKIDCKLPAKSHRRFK